MSNYPIFPENFVFGAATASYQIEGAWNEDGKSESIWDRFSHTPGKIKFRHTGDVACDHYHRYKKDINLMHGLNLDAYRFSISWPRILPNGTGEINNKGLDFYNNLVDKLLEKGIEPYVTLYHWDLPQCLQDKGGFVKRDCAKYFADYCQIVVKNLGDRIKNWITFNEIWMNTMVGYLIGYHAPGKKSPKKALNAAHHEMLAHGLGVKVIRSLFNDATVGVTLDLSPIYPRTDTEKDKKAAHYIDLFKNRWCLDPVLKGEYPAEFLDKLSIFKPDIKDGDLDIIGTDIDFLGINNYSRDKAYYKWWVPRVHAWVEGEDIPRKEFIRNDVQYTAMGTEVYPDSIYEVLMRIKNEYNNHPVIITENGASYSDKVVDGKVHDPMRMDYLQKYIAKVHQALTEGADVRGYFCWSLMDNFEWAEGYNQRLGLIYVDYDTQERIIKDSGHWFAGLIRAKKN